MVIMKRLLLLSSLLGSALGTSAQLYVQSGETVTIQSGGVLHSEGDLVNNGAIAGAGFLDLRASAQNISGTGSLQNLRVSGNANVTPSVDLDLDQLDVQSGSSLTITPNRYVYTTGTLTNNGTVTVQNTASLVQAASSGLAGSGTFHVRRQGTNASSVYNYWSSPITAGTVPGSNAYSFNPVSSTQNYDDDDNPSDPGWQAHSGNMTIGRGYASTNGGLATFTGTVNNGPRNSQNLYYRDFDPNNLPLSVTGTSFNLVGNPYPSAIRCIDLVQAPENAHINGAVYFWADDFSGGSGYDQSDYAIWNALGTVPGPLLGTGGGTENPNGFISSGQGFMVRVEGAFTPGGQTVAPLHFDNDMRTDALAQVNYSNAQFFKPNSDISRLWLSLEGDDMVSEILVGMLDDATDGEDRLYDAAKMRNPKISLGAENEDTEYAIIGFPPPLGSKEIPLRLFVSEDGDYVFHSNTIEGYDNYDLYLEDRSTYSYFPLSEGTQIGFNLSAGDIAGRFYLHIGAQLVTGVRDLETPEVKTWIHDGMLNLRTMNVDFERSSLSLMDMAGRLVWTIPSVHADRASWDVSHLSRGIYVARLDGPSGIFGERVVR
jgi:hypothetical protein